jgi:membrane-associated phospholipid phosphatase
VVAVTLILEAMVFITTTFIVGRERPPVPHLDGSPVGSSFPSGHVAAAVCYAAIAIVAGRNCARRWIVVTLWTIAVATPIIVGVSRMYRGMHFMSDVVAGMILGVVSVVVTLLILTPAERARRARALPPAQRTADTDLGRVPASPVSAAPVSASPVLGGIS